MALDCQHGFRQQSRPLASAWPLLVIRTWDLNTDPSCSRAVVPDMAMVATPALISHDLRCHCSPLASACSSHCHVSSSASLHSHEPLCLLLFLSTRHSLIIMAPCLCCLVVAVVLWLLSLPQRTGRPTVHILKAGDELANVHAHCSWPCYTCFYV